jgi:hypothetical protein
MAPRCSGEQSRLATAPAMTPHVALPTQAAHKSNLD